MTIKPSHVKFSNIAVRRARANKAIMFQSERANQIDKDRAILSQDKQNLKDLAREKVEKELEAELIALQQGVEEVQQEAAKSLERARRVDPVAFTQRATVLGPLLAGMNDDQLLSAYQARHGNKLDRLFLDEAIKLRLDTGGAEAEKLNHRYTQLQEQLRGSLPPDEREALDFMDFAAVMNRYAEDAVKEISFNAAELKAPLKTEESVARKRLMTDLDRLEADYNLR